MDPYRTLGLSPGAPLADVKRAYRRLAKAAHPDTAGPASVARFLAIQRAYEAIAGATGATGAGDSRSPGGGAPRPPWQADPERARATRQAWRERARSRGTAGGSGARRQEEAGDAGAGAPAGERAKARRPGSGTAPGSNRGTGGPDGTGPSSEPGRSRPGAHGGERRRATRKATLGSTTYDDAEESFEPAWGGASWYGETSGTYWTINPREYADPRKHGPEYLARARRAGGGGAAAAATAAEAGTASSRGPAADGPQRDAGTAGGQARAGASEPKTTDRPGHGPSLGSDHARARAAARRAGSAGGPAAAPPQWEAAAGRSAEPAAGRGAEPEPGRAASAPAFASSPATAPGTASPSAPHSSAEPGTAAATASPTAQDAVPGAPAAAKPSADRASLLSPFRFARLLIAWVPFALAAGWIAGEATGCAAYRASCSPPLELLPWLLAALVLLALVALPRLASLAAAGGAAVGLAAVPVAVVLVAAGASSDPVRGPGALAAVLALAWLGGVALELRGRRILSW